ncbi:THAP domain-containing protein 1-like isoform X2 [Helicoverpa zea]|uniref:THAP domain-containing protein 1-like isoform X2 n=1 Tax=Helicoverpa zea TaxID=7113 RepID=UPI001F55F137|nr:THAP domain-containing protein 1-like isoform X2 [Helicoverpa zea]
MPTCCIVECGASKHKNPAGLSLHKFPTKNDLRTKWLEAIGVENINSRHKIWFVCSLHFEANCFNRTLDVLRLRDNSVPTLLLTPKNGPQESLVSHEITNIRKHTGTGTSTDLDPLLLSHENINQTERRKNTQTVPYSETPKNGPQQSLVAHEITNIRKHTGTGTSTELDPLLLSHENINQTERREKTQTVPYGEFVKLTEKVKALKNRCLMQQKKIKRLHEMIRRRNKKIANLGEGRHQQPNLCKIKKRAERKSIYIIYV